MSAETNNFSLDAYLEIVDQFEWLRYWTDKRVLEEIDYPHAIIACIVMAETVGLTGSEIENAKFIGIFRGLQKRQQEY